MEETPLPEYVYGASPAGDSRVTVAHDEVASNQLCTQTERITSQSTKK